MALPDLRSLFSPEHVALLGVSKDPRRDSNAYLRVLVEGGYQGKITVLGYGDYGSPNVITRIEDLPEDVDVVFNMLRPSLVESTSVIAASKGAKFGIVFAGGFAEAGDEGAQVQHRIVEESRAAGMRIIGPNCMGIFNTWHSMNLSEIEGIPRGNIGLVSQSGNNGITMVREAAKYGVGLSSFVSFGNQADVPAQAYVRELGRDPNTRVIILYLEGLQGAQGADFIATCREVSMHTPIVALKGGRGTAGSRAAASHTASLSQAPHAYAALFRQAGIIEVEHLHHLMPAAEALLRCPPLRGERISIVGSGGGHSTVAADAIEAVGLEVPEYDASLQSKIADRLPFGAPVKNPIDMTGLYLQDAGLFGELTELTLEDDGYDGAVCYGLYGPEHWPATQPDPDLAPSEAGPALGVVQAKYAKPIIFFTIFADEKSAHLDRIREAGVPVYSDMATVATAMSVLRQRARHLHLASPPSTCRFETAPGLHVVVDEHESLETLASYGVPVPRFELVDSAEAVGQAVERLSCRVVVKGVLPGIGHKSELGAVKLSINSPEAGVVAAHEIAASVTTALGDGRLKGFLVVEDLGRNRELIVGVQRDEIFGALVVVGAGGVHAEQIRDVATGIAPISTDDMGELVRTLHSSQVWMGSRGQARVDLGALVAMITALTDLLAADPSIASIDVNPVIITDDGRITAVDAAIHLGETL